MKIFISYRRADSTYLIGRIRDRLITAFGDETVFRDLDDIPAGVDFRTVLEEETNAAGKKGDGTHEFQLIADNGSFQTNATVKATVGWKYSSVIDQTMMEQNDPGLIYRIEEMIDVVTSQLADLRCF